MSTQKIENGRYWNTGWQLIDGCTPCSPGCEKCWSASMTHRFKHPKSDSHIHDGLMTDDSGRFTGVIYTHPERLSIPLKRRKPTVYSIWNDWCHEDVTDGFRRQILATVRQCPQHTIIALTKRVDVLAAFTRWMEIHAAPFSWPENWWNILTICTQDEADKKLAIFLQIPGKKGLSIEPMLGAVDVSKHLRGDCAEVCPEGNDCSECCSARMADMGPRLIDTVILGGETGPGARPMHLDWVRSVRDQCQSAGVPFFFKNWGSWKIADESGLVHGCWREADNTFWYGLGSCDKEDINMQKTSSVRRLLDGRTHDDLPWVKE